MRGEYSRNLSRFDHYEKARAEFRLIVSDGFDTARGICEGRAGPALRPVITEARPGGENVYTVGALDYLSDKLANVLRGSGVGGGDRVAAMLDQAAARVIAYLAAWKAGAIAVPLSPRSEPRQARDLMQVATPKAAFIQDSCDPTLIGLIKGLGASVFIVSDDVYSLHTESDERNFWKETYEASSDFGPAAGLSDPHAFLFRVRGFEDEPG
ncbi:MAG TPA: class I adenylate-forming enzyme family protein [Blastocatellia bacterium]|nr:class I adenylate-forming enzyme family protein [Blastocatellia bacterium]